MEIAKKVVDSDDIRCAEAVDIDESRKYDLVMSDSVFQYFESVEYAGMVLEKMLRKSSKMVVLLEIHDKAQEEAWIKMRRETIEDYDAKYEGLGKLFIEKEWIRKIAKQFGREVKFTSSYSEHYWNSQYIYNCYIY